jgi:hypothetical protein
MSDTFDLGDFIEELPYEGGPGSPDEYIANSLIVKRLQLRNKELAPSLVAVGRRYIASTDSKHYVGLSRRENYEYSPDVAKLEAEIKKLEKVLAAKKALERETGAASLKEPTPVLSVRAMTAEIQDRIDHGADTVNPMEETEYDL